MYLKLNDSNIYLGVNDSFVTFLSRETTPQ